MAIIQHTFKLLEKKQLTHDVFELHFFSSTATKPAPGQYIIFVLSSGLRRAYSVSYHSGDIFTFIIKRKPFEGAGSREICDLEIGSELFGLGSLGHFKITEWDIPRLFIGTGTGFAPLYFQVRDLEDRKFTAKTSFVFWVREGVDMFYEEELTRLSEKFPNFSFTQFLSREEKEGTKKGYVSDILTPEYVNQFQEFYLCGSPDMVKGSREILENLGIPKEKVLFEQY